MKQGEAEIADLVLLGGTVYTMDPLKPRAEGLAVKGGRVVSVGSAAEVSRTIGPKTQVIELKGRAVTPGLVDGHCHLFGLGHWSEMLSLRGVKSADEAAARVKAATTTRAGEWIQGRGWDQNLWTPPEFPTKALLDRASPGQPVLLRRVDGHAVWVNSAALKLAGVTRDTRDPPGGKILRDAAGEPTGVLVDNAMDLVETKVAPDTREVRERKLLAAQEQALAAGLTGVHEMGIDDETIAAYRSLEGSGRLKLRVYAYLSGELLPSLATRKPDRDEDGTRMFVVRGLKLFADGALGSRGAALFEPYADDPGNSGLVLASEEELTRAAKNVAEAGWQLAVHAIGDRANHAVLNAFEKAGSGQKGRDLRFRVEHAQVLKESDIARFRALEVIASMQPTHATSDMPWADERLGPERLRGAYAWRSVLATGAHLVGGSDFPVEEVSPLLAFYAGVTRQDPKGEPAGGWLPEQKLELEEVIHMFTVAPAWAAFAERHRGRIAPGFVADLTVFDGELVPDKTLLETRVDTTIVGGQVVYDRPR
jgi:predicted amidohydrolase YtcJ